MQDRARGLDHGPDAHRRLGLRVAQAAGDGRDIRNAGDLGNQDAIRLGLGNHFDVIGPPWRIQRIGPNPDLAFAKAAGRDRLRDLVARKRFGFGCDRILKVQNDAVGGKDARLLQRPRIRPGHEQEAAARTDHVSIPFDFEHVTGETGTVGGLLFERDILRPRLNISAWRSKGLFRPTAYG
jgi:hypothetical protein